MKTQELKDLAVQVAQVENDDLAEFTDLLFDEIIEGKSREELDWTRALLDVVGVDVTGICKRKIAGQF